jgi:biotin-(acetyl-CoA carboxylase) ligase
MAVRTPVREVSAPDLTLPPLFRAVRLRELGDAFAHAKAIAHESGAGTLVYVGRFDLAEFALVLEPDEKLAQARRAFYAGMTALADALAALAEPETAIGIQWPDSLYVNYGLVGGGRLAWPDDAREDETPPWLVFGGMIRIASMSGLEPGATPSSTALAEEGFSGLIAERLIESFARHFMVTVDAWQDSGFGAVARSYLPRLPAENGVRSDIDESGDLLLRRAGKTNVERKKLVAALAKPAWFDPLARGPQT